MTDPFSGTQEPGNVRDLSLLAKGGLISLVGSVLIMVSGFVFQFFLARFLGTAQVGLFSLAFTIATFAGVVIAVGLPTGVLRFVSLYQGSGDQERVLDMTKKN